MTRLRCVENNDIGWRSDIQSIIGAHNGSGSLADHRKHMINVAITRKLRNIGVKICHPHQ